MIGHQNRDRVLGQSLQEGADLLVELPVVVLKRRLELVPGLIERVAGVEVLPEDVMEPVRSHLDHHEEVPWFVADQSPGDLETPPGHLEHLLEHELETLFAEVRHVEDVPARPAELVLDLRLQACGIRVALG